MSHCATTLWTSRDIASNAKVVYIHIYIYIYMHIRIYIFFSFFFVRERRPFPPHESAQRVHAPLESKAAKAVGEAKAKPEP